MRVICHAGNKPKPAKAPSSRAVPSKAAAAPIWGSMGMACPRPDAQCKSSELAARPVANASTPPMPASTTVSIATWRRTLVRLAPSAIRVAISISRCCSRAICRLARFRHPTRRITTAIAIRMIRGREYLSASEPSPFSADINFTCERRMRMRSRGSLDAPAISDKSGARADVQCAGAAGFTPSGVRLSTHNQKKLAWCRCDRSRLTYPGPSESNQVPKRSVASAARGSQRSGACPRTTPLKSFGATPTITMGTPLKVDRLPSTG